jgi:hypothetical protein
MGSPPSVDYLAKLATINPGILSRLPDTLREQLRDETALEELFPYQNDRKWEPGERGYVPFERQFAKNMLRFAANQLYNLEMFKCAKVKQVRILCAGIDQSGKTRECTCRACRPFHNGIYSIQAVPELPNPGCTGFYGCRCRFDAILE